MKITAKRIYDAAEKSDGYRVLVDRLWPRGVLKADAHIDAWEKQITPSADLRTWFHKDREGRFKEFTQKYAQELKQTQAIAAFKKSLHGHATVTLVSAAKDLEHSHVAVLLKKLNR